MASKFYVVWSGRETGIFTDWNTCKKHVDGFNGARYKSFLTREEAEVAFSGSKSTVAAGRVPTASGAKIKTYSAAEANALPEQIKIFTDGGCEPNPGEAGSGVAVYQDNKLRELWYGLYNPMGTNNTAELNALHQGLLLARDEIASGKTVAVFSDSQYSIQCVIQWAIGWEKAGWKKKGGEIKNLELIKDIYTIYQTLKDKVQVLHVNGHVGVQGNELADRMSILAIQSRETDFALYREAFDVAAILATRAG
jgi:ribonuclease HI